MICANAAGFFTIFGWIALIACAPNCCAWSTSAFVSAWFILLSAAANSWSTWFNAICFSSVVAFVFWLISCFLAVAKSFNTPVAVCFLVTCGWTAPIWLTASSLMLLTIAVVDVTPISVNALFLSALTRSIASCFSSRVAPGVALIFVITSRAFSFTVLRASVLTCVAGWITTIFCIPWSFACATSWFVSAALIFCFAVATAWSSNCCAACCSSKVASLLLNIALCCVSALWSIAFLASVLTFVAGSMACIPWIAFVFTCSTSALVLAFKMLAFAAATAAFTLSIAACLSSWVASGLALISAICCCASCDTASLAACLTTVTGAIGLMAFRPSPLAVSTSSLVVAWLICSKAWFVACVNSFNAAFFSSCVASLLLFICCLFVAVAWLIASLAACLCVTWGTTAPIVLIPLFLAVSTSALVVAFVTLSIASVSSVVNWFNASWISSWVASGVLLIISLCFAALSRIACLAFGLTTGVAVSLLKVCIPWSLILVTPSSVVWSPIFPIISFLCSSMTWIAACFSSSVSSSFWLTKSSMSSTFLLTAFSASTLRINVCCIWFANESISAWETLLFKGTLLRFSSKIVCARLLRSLKISNDANV